MAETLGYSERKLPRTVLAFLESIEVFSGEPARDPSPAQGMVKRMWERVSGAQAARMQEVSDKQEAQHRTSIIRFFNQLQNFGGDHKWVAQIQAFQMRNPDYFLTRAGLLHRDQLSKQIPGYNQNNVYPYSVRHKK